MRIHGFLTTIAILCVLSACSTTGAPIPGSSPSPESLTIYQLYIQQTDPAIAIENDVDSEATLVLSNGSSEIIAVTTMSIAGRGNSTWYYSYPDKKLPYKITFDPKVEMPGMGEAKKWVLLANRFDKSLMKNMLAFDLAQKLSFNFANRYRLAELHLNGTHMGLYLITDQIEVDESLRVKTGTTDPKTDTKPGFLVEWDDKIAGESGMVEGVDYFHIDNIDQDFAFKGPKVKELSNVPGDAARLYISNTIAQASAAILGCSGNLNYTNLIDLTSFYDYFIVNEFARNNDAASYSSIYLTKPKNGKLMMGPVWDFDIGFGWIAGCDNPEAWYIRNESPWYSSLISKSSFFSSGLKARWNEVKGIVYETMVKNIDFYEAQMTAAATTNHNIWGELGSHIYLWEGTDIQYPLNPTNYAQVVDYLRQWVKTRYTWMDTHMNNGDLTNFNGNLTNF